MSFNNFSCLTFDPKMCQYAQAQKYPRGQNVSVPQGLFNKGKDLMHIRKYLYVPLMKWLIRVKEIFV